eukprot:3433999-Prorocentrum_lima.AAC.1
MQMHWEICGKATEASRTNTFWKARMESSCFHQVFVEELFREASKVRFRQVTSRLRHLCLHGFAAFGQTK